VCDRRITRRFFRRAILAASLSCAAGSTSSAADLTPSREYPNTYSSRKAPWYDPLRVFTTAPKAPDPKPTKVETTPLPVSTPVPMWKETLRPVEIPANPVLAIPMHSATPAWKWYGYGTPSHNSFANGPAGWHASTGATTGAVPLEPQIPNAPVVFPTEFPKPAIPLVVPQPARPESPLVIVPPSEGPKLTDTPVSPPAGVDWKSAPSASLKLPMNETPSVKADSPGASLRSPVPLEKKAANSSPEYSTPASQISPPTVESKDIPVVPAPGIVVPK